MPAYSPGQPESSESDESTGKGKLGVGWLSPGVHLARVLLRPISFTPPMPVILLHDSLFPVILSEPERKRARVEGPRGCLYHPCSVREFCRECLSAAFVERRTLGVLRLRANDSGGRTNLTGAPLRMTGTGRIGLLRPRVKSC